MKRRMAESGEDPVLRFDNLEDNRDVPVQFDGVEVAVETGGIEERCKAMPGEAKRQYNREFVAHVRANMPEEEVREINAEAQRVHHDLLPEQERDSIQAEDTEAHRAKRRRSQTEETKKYEMRFDTTEEEYFRIMNEENVDYDVIFVIRPRVLQRRCICFMRIWVVERMASFESTIGSGRENQSIKRIFAGRLIRINRRLMIISVCLVVSFRITVILMPVCIRAVHAAIK